MLDSDEIVQYSILHVCGDDPKVDEPKQENKEYSPRMWR